MQPGTFSQRSLTRGGDKKGRKEREQRQEEQKSGRKEGTQISDA